MENELRKGEKLFTDGRIEDAEDQFLSIVEKDSESKEAYNNLGVIAFQKNDIKSAIDYFSRSLEIDYSYKDAVFNYVDLLRTLNQPKIAAPLLEKIAEKYPDDREIKQLLDDLYSSHNDFRIKSEIKLSEYSCNQDLVSSLPMQCTPARPSGHSDGQTGKIENQIGFSITHSHTNQSAKIVFIQVLRL